MIASFYDKNFKGLQNNASLVISKDSYSLIKRPVEMNTLSCVCEPFTEDIQPTFLVIQDNKGGYVYGCLAGIPLLNENNQTEINGTDLKSMLSSDVILQPTTYDYVNDYITYIFNQWKEQVNQNSFNVELNFTDNLKKISEKEDYREPMTDLQPNTEKDVYNAYDELAQYLKYYDLYIEGSIDLINKKVVFTIGRTMFRTLNIRLWEYGIRNYGKWVADTNEAQGYYNNNGTWQAGYKWILTSSNDITTNESLRDIYPIKRTVVVNTESLEKANEESLTELLNSLYNENIDLNADDILQANANFETKFAIYLKQGAGKYKDLPCGELQYDATGLIKVQIGYRYSGVDFI
mgnify:CR=1 FL=1